MTPTWPTPAQIEQSARALDPEAWAILDSDSIGMMTRRKVSLEQARAALRAVNPFEWMPIETVPDEIKRTQTEIIGLFHRDYGSSFGATTYGPWTIAWDGKKWRSSWDGSRVIESETDFGTDYKDPDPEPTHWHPFDFPLPPSPEGDK